MSRARSNPTHRAPRARRRYGRIAAAVVAPLTAVALPVVAMVSPAAAANDSTWNRLANCESSGDWHINTGNGFFGGVQFAQSTWAGFGGTGYAPRANLASRGQQIAIAEKVLAVQGWGAWPSCSAQLGLGAADAAGTPTPAKRAGSTDGSYRASAHRSATRSYGSAYVVRRGDTLAKIAERRNVSGGWHTLYSLNRGVVNNPGLIYVGQRLRLP